jgi:sortase (surface protein transpeptidase)
MNRRAASVLSLTPLILVSIVALVVLTSGPSPRSATAVADAPAWTAAETDPNTATSVHLPETRGPDASEAPRVLDVAGLRIVLPRLGIDLPLDVGDPERDVPRPGFAGATPEHRAFVYPGSRSPGDSGNTYIYAHARAGMFLSLWNAKLGDTVVIARGDGSIARSYHITLIVPRVDPTDTRWLDAQGDERLTLQTSTGPRAEDPRFIVVAHPVAGPSEAHRLP